MASLNFSNSPRLKTIKILQASWEICRNTLCVCVRVFVRWFNHLIMCNLITVTYIYSIRFPKVSYSRSKATATAPGFKSRTCSIITISTLPFSQDISISRLRWWFRTSQDTTRRCPNSSQGIDIRIATFDGSMCFTQRWEVRCFAFHLTWASREHFAITWTVSDVMLAWINVRKITRGCREAAR